jgi:DNA-binding response OmpR family regulator
LAPFKLRWHITCDKTRNRKETVLNNAALVVGERETELVVGTALECAGFACSRFASTLALLRGIKRDDLRLIVLDIDDASVDWQAVLAWRRSWLNPTVVVIALGNADIQTTVRTLEAGADDYIPKPVSGAELLARVNAATRRRGGAPSGAAAQALSVAGCTVDGDACCLRSERSRVALTGRELALTQLLFEQVGKLVTRQRLATEVWGAQCDLSGRTIEQHVYQVRRKLKQCVGEALHLRSIYGSGYRLDRPGRPTTGHAP